METSWPVGKKQHVKSVVFFFFDVVCLFFFGDLFGMDFFGTPIIGLCPDLFFFFFRRSWGGGR